MKTLAGTIALSMIAALPMAAQSNLKSAPSTRASIEVTLAPPRVQGQPAPAPAKIKIDYGQPHARGRAVAGALADDLGKVWRFGANTSTTITTDVDLVVGGLTVPKGSYSLYTETTATGAWKLIINTNTGQWGTEYLAEKDLGRVALTSKTLTNPVESFTVWMVPAGDGSPKGDLRFAWGSREFTTTWAAK